MCFEDASDKERTVHMTSENHFENATNSEVLKQH